MRARGWFAAAILAIYSTAATGDPKPTAVDPKPFKSKALVFQDAAGGTYVVVPGDEPQVFYGTAKTLYQQVITGGSKNGDAWSINTWAPRIPEMRPGEIERRQDGSFWRNCSGADDVGLTQLAGDKAKQILDKYAFMSPILIRRPYLLARDESAVYYYVDRLSEAAGGKSFRVFVGKKGAMKALPLTDVASDSVGDVFTTKTGDLRFVRTTEEGKTTLTWVRGEKRTNLIAIDVDVNSPLIFKDLGVYGVTGTLCENI